MAAILLDDVHQVIFEVGEYPIAAQDPDAAKRPIAMRHMNAQRRTFRIQDRIKRGIVRLANFCQRPAIADRAARANSPTS